MFRLKTHSRRAVAASLLGVFLNVFFGQVVCALAMPAVPAVGSEHQHPAGTPPHHHNHAHGAGQVAPAPHHHHDGNEGPTPPAPHKHGGKGEKGGNCCQDDAAAVWASLAHPPKAGIEKMTFMPVALPPAPLAVLVARSQHWNRTAAVRLVPPRHLPPKIPDIRIFIRSLTV